MYVLIMRHGEAVDARLVGSDARRHLTSAGRKQSVAVAEALRARQMAPSHVYASPFVRALQTAEAVRHVIGLETELPVHPALVPGGAIASALSVLEQHGTEDCVLLVSHEPTVRVLSRAIAGTELPPFPTSGVAVFERGVVSRFLGRVDPALGWRGPAELGI